MKAIVKKNSKQLLVVIFFLLLCNILNVLHPYIMKQILDMDFMAENIVPMLEKVFILYAIVHIAFMLSKNIRNTIINKVMAKIVKELREKLFCHVLQWDMSTYQKYNSSEIYTRLTADVENVSSLFLSTLQIVLNNVLYIAIMVIFMFVVDVKLALIGSVAIILTMFISCFFTNQVAKANQMILNKRDKENKQFSEMYNKHKLTYLFGLQNKNIETIHTTMDEEYGYRKKYIWMESFIYPLVITVQALTIWGILKYALHSQIMIPLGSIYLVINYIQKCRVPLNEIFTQLEEVQLSFMSLKRINCILKEKGKEDIQKGEAVENLKGDIEFVNVHMQ